MKVISADTEEHYNLSWTEGRLHVVEDGAFRILMLLDEKRDETIILSVKAVK